MPKLGTLAWLESTRGRMTAAEMLGFAARAVHAQVALAIERRTIKPVRYRDVSDIVPPDTAICTEALRVAQADCEPFLFNHCMRAYFFARLIDDGQRTIDHEAFFVATMLHDLGLAEKHRLSGSGPRCFTAVGVGHAQTLGQAHGWSDRRTSVAAQAIALHLNVVVADAFGPEAALLRFGTGADVAGLGTHRLRADQIESVCAHHPRLGMKREITRCFEIEARERPRSRAGFMTRRLGFKRYIARTTAFGD
ncbi:MAG: hypothetical protein AAGJ54_10900 [Planctomycetota bacterium]